MAVHGIIGGLPIMTASAPAVGAGVSAANLALSGAAFLKAPIDSFANNEACAGFAGEPLSPVNQSGRAIPADLVPRLMEPRLAHEKIDLNPRAYAPLARNVPTFGHWLLKKAANDTVGRPMYRLPFEAADASVDRSDDAQLGRGGFMDKN